MYILDTFVDRLDNFVNGRVMLKLREGDANPMIRALCALIIYIIYLMIFITPKSVC